MVEISKSGSGEGPGWVTAGPTRLQGVMTAVDDLPDPVGNVLHQNSPNPFNPSTTIRFDLQEPAGTQLRVYDMSGRLVRVLLNQKWLEGGNHGTVWDGRDGVGRPVSAGIYVYRIDAGTFRSTKLMTLVK